MINIIGVSGHIGAGKDEVTKIIQYLTSKDPHIKQDYITLSKRWETDKFDWNLLSDWKNKKFADGLKDIVCILIGCTREQLEDRDFKNSVLGEEWTRYGKADGFMHVFKNGEQKTVMNNKACSKEEYEEELRVNWQTAYKHEYTVREVLQYVGTDLLRNQFHPDVHVNMLFSKYKEKHFNVDYGYDEQGNRIPLGSITALSNWIISDVRFPNEADAIKQRGGVNIRVRRELRPMSDNGVNMLKHPSETALDNYQFDWVIDNDGTIEDLVNAVRDILKAENII